MLEAAAYAAANDTVFALEIESEQRKFVDEPIDEFDEFGVVDDVPPFCSYITAAMAIGSMKLKFGNVLFIGGVFDDDGSP